MANVMVLQGRVIDEFERGLIRGLLNEHPES